jgi:hypothetical protein
MVIAVRAAPARDINAGADPQLWMVVEHELWMVVEYKGLGRSETWTARLGRRDLDGETWTERENKGDRWQETR